MPGLSRIVKEEYEKEYDLKPKQYTIGICDFSGDLSKKWYVWYSCRHPGTGKLVRQPPIYVSSKQKTIRARNKELLAKRDIVEQYLKDGYNAFESPAGIIVDKPAEYTIAQAVAFVLKIKKNQYKTGYPDFKSRLDQFQGWLEGNGFSNRRITEVNKQAVINYLNFVLEKNSPRNRNNTRTALSTFFTVLKDNNVVAENFVKDINKLDAPPERNKTYTGEVEEKIYQRLLETEDGRRLLLYIQFISYNLLRPIEVNRLFVDDLDLAGRVLSVKTKNKTLKRKRIPEIMIELLPDLTGADPGSYLFGRNGLGQPWEANEMSRRQYYSDLFKELIKIPFKLGKDYGLYSFRHTVIVKLLNALLATHSMNQAKSILMGITGHDTMEALEMYLRDIDAVLADDYSHLLRKS